MTEKYNDIECALGISTYASLDHAGFAGVSKARYSDFVVHEVDPNGNVARLENMSVIQEQTNEEVIHEQQEKEKKEQESSSSSSSGNKRKFCDAIDEKNEKDSKEEKMEEGGDEWSSINSKLTEWVGSDVTQKVVDMLQYWENDSKGKANDDGESGGKTENLPDKCVVLPPIKDKGTRRSVHEWIRSSLPVARGDTHEGNIRIWHKRFEKEMPNYGKFDRNESNNRPNQKLKKKWPSDRPDYLSFVLYKENIDTGTAIKDITRQLGGGGSGGRGRHKSKIRYGYAGMKDKRGITSQFCTLYRKEANELLCFNQPPKGEGGIRGGGGHTNKGGVSIIRVGNFSYVKDEIRLGMLKGNRFDIVLRNVAVSPLSSIPSDSAHDAAKQLDVTKSCLEKAASDLREYGFINYFGMQRFGKFYDTHKVGIAVLKGDFEEAVNIIMKPKPDESPRISMARGKWDKRFVGDKRDDDKSTSELTINDKEQIEANCAKEVVRDLGRFMTCEVAILNCLARKPLDYKRAFSHIPKTMRMMFLHAVQSYLWNHIASHRLDTMSRNQVLPGDLVLLDEKQGGGNGDPQTNTSGLSGKSVKIVTDQDVSLKKYSMTDLVLPLVGTKVEYPSNSCGALYDSLLDKEGLKKSHFKKLADPELALGGDYRKIICKPSDVEFEVKEYHDPLQPLLYTDLMKLNKVSLDEGSKSNEDATNEVLLGLVISFTLPPSAYATIALRELMKRPTSSDYQQKLKLQGWCEQDVVDTKVSEPVD